MSNILRQWAEVENPLHIKVNIPHPPQTVPAITCLLFSNGRIIAAADSASIYIYLADTGRLAHTLNGHQGGVWALKVIDDTLVSASTDKTIRVWDLFLGRCIQIFSGHQNTIRCLEIVEPSWNMFPDPKSGVPRKESWPSRPYLVSGARDCTVRLWALPRSTDQVDSKKPNPYHKKTLTGHKGAVKSLAARGRLAVSASHDSTLRVWDLIEGRCNFELSGHTDIVQCVTIDPVRPQAYSGSADKTIRIWNIWNGECIHILTGHTEIIGVLSISRLFLVSASADETVRVWHPETGVMVDSFHGGTTVFSDDEGLITGSTHDSNLQLWRMKDGELLRTLKGPRKGCQAALFSGSYCISAGKEERAAVLDIWNFTPPSDEMDVDKLD